MGRVVHPVYVAQVLIDMSADTTQSSSVGNVEEPVLPLRPDLMKLQSDENGDDDDENANLQPLSGIP